MQMFQKQLGSSIYLIHLIIYAIGILFFLIKDVDKFLYFVYIFLVLINASAITKLSSVDPGFVNKKFKNTNVETSFIFDDNTVVEKYFAKSKWYMAVQIESKKEVYEYCEECNIFKIERIHHCRDCNSCVHDFDHHCYWFEKCIARNNLVFFYIYLFSTTLLLSTVILTFYKLYYFSKFVLQVPYKFVNGIFITFIIVFSFFFTGFSLFSLYYIYLALTNIKSHEFIKNKKRVKKLEFISCLKRALRDHRIITNHMQYI